MEVTKLVPRLSDIDAYDDETLGYVSAKSILCRGELVTAIFGGTDATAQGVYKALKEYRLSIPDDVSVVGCNDTFARLLDPPLTTIREFPDLIGKRLAELLLERISSPDIPPRVVTVPTQLARNESSGPVSLPVGDANLQIRNALEMRGSKPNSE
jgi:LacI family transcriptional regulator